jgi:glycosyltransferase involved in cell wall biosynthesis
MRSCAVVIPTWRRAALVRACLEAILAAPPAVQHELVVVDDGSGDEIVTTRATLGNHTTLVERRENARFAYACSRVHRARGR